jgi:acyl carrier protein
VNIEQAVKEIIAEIKKMDLTHLNFTQNANFIEELNLDSFEVVSFVDKLDKTFNIDFGAHSIDFDSLKSWSALLANIENKLTNK